MSGPIQPHTPAEKKVLLFSSFLLLFFLVLDQATKLLVMGTMRLRESIVLIPGWFNLTYVRNTGAAWSMLAGFPWLLLGFGAAAGILVIVFFRRWSEGFPERYAALSLIESGIIGNSIDRLWHGAVIDFLHVHYYEVYHYPVFNVADCAICVGVGLFILSNLLRKNPGGSEEPGA